MTVDAYLDSAPEPQQTTLRALRTALTRILPEGVEGISYGVPAILVGEKAIAGYSYSKNHCSYLPHSGSALSEIDPEKLAGYEWSKGALRFPIDEPLDEDLIGELVRLRLAQLDNPSR